jgi:hypothetical protein
LRNRGPLARQCLHGTSSALASVAWPQIDFGCWREPPEVEAAHSCYDFGMSGPSALPPDALPRLTAVMLMPGSFSTLTASLSSLNRQSIKDRIELVLVHTPAFESTTNGTADRRN